MKRIYKLMVTTALCAAIISVCIVPAYADSVTDVLWGIIEWSVAPESTWEDEDLAVMLRKMWPTSVSGGQIEITYDELQSLCTSLNMTGYPCHISRSNTSYAIVGDGNVVGLGFTFSIDGRFCANSEGYVFVAPTNTNLITVVQTIETMLQNIYDRIDALADTLVMQDPLEEWLQLFYAQIEVVQLRQELVNLQLDDLIEAVEGLSVVGGGDVIFDTISITDKLEEVIAAVNGIDFDTVPITNRLDDLIEGLSYLRGELGTDLFSIANKLDGLSGDLSDLIQNTDVLPSISAQLRTLGGYVSQIASAQTVGIPGKMDELLDAINNMDIVIEDNDSVITPITTPSCNHDFTTYNKVAASCSTPGFKRYTCKLCDFSYYDLVQPLGHSWQPYFYPDEYHSSGYVWELVWTEVSYYEGEDGYYPVGAWPVEGNTQYRVVVDGLHSATGTARVGKDFWDDISMQVRLGFPSFGTAFLSENEFWLYGSEGVGNDSDEMESITINIYKRVPSETVEPILELQYCDRCGSGKDFNAMLHFLNGQFKQLEYTITNVGDGISFEPLVERMDTIISLMDNSLGVTGCEHVYVSEINQEQTCILPGLQTFTCESCGSSYSEILESLGHDWQCTGHVEDELDLETGEVLSSGYDIYTCSRCSDSYNDYEGSGAPAAESNSLTGIISRVFEKLGTLVGDLLSMGVRLLDKLLTGFDDLVTSFNEKTQQIVNFGSGYTAWLSGFWDIVPSDLQLVWGFCLAVVCIGIVGKKLFFTS